MLIGVAAYMKKNALYWWWEIAEFDRVCSGFSPQKAPKRTRNSSKIYKKIDHNIFVAGCYNGSGIGVGTLFGEQIAIKASNENSKEIDTIEERNKPTWLPPDPILSIGVRARLIYERFRARSEI